MCEVLVVGFADGEPIYSCSRRGRVPVVEVPTPSIDWDIVYVFKHVPYLNFQEEERVGDMGRKKERMH